MNPKEILQAWKNVLSPTDEVEGLAKERYDTCNSCDEKIEFLSIEVCGQCYCPLKGKTHSPENSCPLNKWLR